MTENEKKFIKDHFDAITRGAIEINDESLFKIIKKIMGLIENSDLETAREAVEEVKYSDFKIKFYVVIACLSRERRDIKMLRRLASEHISRFGSVQTGLLICIAMISQNDFDIQRVRRAIEKNSSFARAQEFLILYMSFGQKQDLESARKAAEIEVPGRIFYKTAGLTMIANFTGENEDYLKMEAALLGIDELSLRKSIPVDININETIKKAVGFKSAVDAVGDIADNYMRAKLWTLIGISQLKTFTRITIV